MRVNQPPKLFGFINQVGEKPDAQGFRQHQQNAGDQAKEEPEKKELDPETLEEALSAFRADPQAAAAGLTAEPRGKGPGLKIILKDGSGVVLRQLSGDEFLRLRQSLGESNTRSGKIIDQKL